MTSINIRSLNLTQINLPHELSISHSLHMSYQYCITFALLSLETPYSVLHLFPGTVSLLPLLHPCHQNSLNTIQATPPFIVSYQHSFRRL